MLFAYHHQLFLIHFLSFDHEIISAKPAQWWDGRGRCAHPRYETRLRLRSGANRVLVGLGLAPVPGLNYVLDRGPPRNLLLHIFNN